METDTLLVPRVEEVKYVTQKMILVYDAGKKLKLKDVQCRSLWLLFQAGLTKVRHRKMIYFYKEELANHLGITAAQLEEGFLTSEEACEFLGCTKYVINELIKIGLLPEPYRIHKFQWSQDLFLKSQLVEANAQFLRTAVTKGRFSEVLSILKLIRGSMSEQIRCFFEQGRLDKRGFDILKGKIVDWKGNDTLAKELHLSYESIRLNFEKNFPRLLRFVKKSLGFPTEKYELLKQIEDLRKKNQLLEKQLADLKSTSVPH